MHACNEWQYERFDGVWGWRWHSILRMVIKSLSWQTCKLIEFFKWKVHACHVCHQITTTSISFNVYSHAFLSNMQTVVYSRSNRLKWNSDYFFFFVPVLIWNFFRRWFPVFFPYSVCILFYYCSSSNPSSNCS